MERFFCTAPLIFQGAVPCFAFAPLCIIQVPRAPAFYDLYIIQIVAFYDMYDSVIYTDQEDSMFNFYNMHCDFYEPIRFKIQIPKLLYAVLWV